MTNWQLVVTAQGEKCWELYRSDRSWAVEAASKLQSETGSTIFVGNDNALKSAFDAEFLAYPKTAGALCTALLAFGRLDLDAPLVIAPGDFTISGDVTEAIEQGFHSLESDAFAVTMTSDDPRLSFLRVDSEGRILEFCEKNPVSSIATTGIFGFRSAGLFLSAAGWVLRNKITFEGSYYVSSALNYFIMSGQQVGNIHLNLRDGEFNKNWGKS